MWLAVLLAATAQAGSSEWTRSKQSKQNLGGQLDIKEYGTELVFRFPGMSKPIGLLAARLPEQTSKQQLNTAAVLVKLVPRKAIFPSGNSVNHLSDVYPDVKMAWVNDRVETVDRFQARQRYADWQLAFIYYWRSYVYVCISTVFNYEVLALFKKIQLYINYIHNVLLNN